MVLKKVKQDKMKDWKEKQFPAILTVAAWYLL